MESNNFLQTLHSIWISRKKLRPLLFLVPLELSESLLLSSELVTTVFDPSFFRLPEEEEKTGLTYSSRGMSERCKDPLKRTLTVFLERNKNKDLKKKYLNVSKRFEHSTYKSPYMM